VTGATGFVGWHLVEAFRAAGCEVRGVVRPGSVKPLPDGVRRVESALDASALARAIDGAEILVHGAALTRAPSAAMYESVNVAGTRAAVDAANRAGARLVLISSQAACGSGRVDRPSREDDCPRPLTAYGRSKLAAESVVRTSARVPWTIVRPSAVYGPRDRAFLPLFRLASRGICLLAGDPAACFTLIYIDDLVRGIVLTATSEQPGGQTFFFGHSDPQPAWKVLQVIAEACGRPYRPAPVPRPALRLAALAGELWWRLGRAPIMDQARFIELTAEGFVCAVDRAREVLGFSAVVSLPDGMARTARWYRERGWTSHP
jgi:nucleoside-diphosphate-sugar epimerase